MAKDHFVPQFYLRNFQIPAQLGRIWQYQRKKEPEPVEIKGIAQEEDYYDLKAENMKKKKDLVDKLLSKSEKSAAGILQKLLEAPNVKLTTNERAYTSLFIALLIGRTPFQRNRFASLEIALRDAGVKEMLKDPNNIEDILLKHPELTREDLDQAMKALFKGHIYLDFNRGGETEDYLMRSQIEFSDNLVPIIYGKHWSLIETDSIPFVTSDNPVVTMPSPYDPREGMGFIDGDILLPLSPKRGLWLTNRMYADTVLTIQKEIMAKFQFYSIAYCDTCVFAHENLPDVQQVLDSTEYGHVYKVKLPKDYKPILRKRDELR